MESIALTDFQTTARITGLTHGFYRYPATTSPTIVASLIRRYSAPDDVVFDPFMGGGTTIVEAMALGRIGVGADINQLAVAVARAKTTPLSEPGWARVAKWALGVDLIAADDTPEPLEALPTVVRRFAVSARRTADGLSIPAERNAARCALLATIKWALESRTGDPDAEQLAARLREQIERMHSGMRELVSEMQHSGVRKSEMASRRTLMPGLADEVAARAIELRQRPRLILTSPPYPGVHVLYHRWQIRSRRETAAPYWLIGARDGHGPAHYTMGGRGRGYEGEYFARMAKFYRAMAQVIAPDGRLVQIIGFSNADDQLARTLAILRDSGFAVEDATSAKRTVPNRRWYTRDKPNDAGTEFLLIHRRA